jgi:hypothetical protein
MLWSTLYVPNLLWTFNLLPCKHTGNEAELSPVTHRETFEFPFITKDVLENVFVLRYVRSIHTIISETASKVSMVMQNK